MSSINETSFRILDKEESIPTLNFVIYSFLTCGVFYIAYIWKNIPNIERNIGKSICNRSFLFAMLLCFGLGLLVEDFGDGNLYYGIIDKDGFVNMFAVTNAYETASVFILIGNVISIVAIIMMIILSFKTVEQLSLVAKEKEIELKVNKFLVFLFNIFYINYLINILDEKIEGKQWS